MMTPKMSNYPWGNLITPSTVGEYVAKLVPEKDNPQGRRVFWAKSWEAHPSLLIEYEADTWKPISLPAFKNIRVSDHKMECSLVIELLDLDMSDIFLKVCLDIIAALQEVPEGAARKVAVLRLERWSSFLKPSRSKLSSEAQKGLIAELRFLRRDAFEAYEIEDALRGWTGPDSGPRDFAYGQLFVEVKSKRGSANASIAISSEDQLNVNPSEHLYLFVSELNDAPLENDAAVTITDVVEETRLLIDSPLQRATFDNKLANVGFFDEDDYSDQKWSEGESYYYAVIDGFPKIDSKACDPGVSKVSYQVDLDYCGDFLVDRDAVIKFME